MHGGAAAVLDVTGLPPPPAFRDVPKVFRSVVASKGERQPVKLVLGVPQHALVAVSDRPPPVACHEGYLYKKGGGQSRVGRRNWTRRYFVFSDGKLRYYQDSSTQGRCKGTVYVYGAQLQRVFTDRRHMHRFDLADPRSTRLLELRADDAAEVDEWVHVLRTAGAVVLAPE